MSSDSVNGCGDEVRLGCESAPAASVKRQLEAEKITVTYSDEATGAARIVVVDPLGAGMTFEPSSGVTSLTSFKAPTANLSREGLQRAWTTAKDLQPRMDSADRFRIAVTRWARAASPGVLSPDRVIDLRIAPKALNLDSDQGELQFRLSITGARHLADGLGDRKAVAKDVEGLLPACLKNYPWNVESQDRGFGVGRQGFDIMP